MLMLNYMIMYSSIFDDLVIYNGQECQCQFEKQSMGMSQASVTNRSDSISTLIWSAIKCRIESWNSFLFDPNMNYMLSIMYWETVKGIHKSEKVTLLSLKKVG